MSRTKDSAKQMPGGGMSHALTSEAAAKLHWQHRERLPVWTITAAPDHPGSHVARLWLTIPTLEITTHALTGPSLDDVRAQLAPLQLYRIERHPSDDPCIVETWI
jgi:hypothetical protein